MKIKKYFFHSVIASILISGILASSCDDSFLDEKLITTYSTDRFKTQEGLDELVTGAYQKLKFKFNYIWGIEMFNMGVDEFTDANNSIPSFNNYSSDLNSAESGANAPFWDNMYSGIESTNTLIQNIPLYYDAENANYDTRLGESYFLRGYYYMLLVAQYGGVPLKLTPSSEVESYFTRASEEECFNQIIADLENAYNLLPVSPEATGRITKWAAAHFLAKAHLTRASELYSDWNSSYVDDDLDAVIKYGQEVIVAHPLAENYSDLWDYQYANSSNESVSEIVLAAQFSDDQITWGRFGNQMHLYYPSVYQDLAGTRRDISGGREFSYVRSTNYALDVFDRINDSRFWKSFITTYGCNDSEGAPEWEASHSGWLPDDATVGDKRFSGGELGIKYIVNKAGDDRYKGISDDATGVIKNGVMENTHTFVRYFEDEASEWVGQHGNFGYYGAQKRSVALSKFRDGYRVSVASQFGTRDAILARSGEDYLMIAEAYIRKGEGYYDQAIQWINDLRSRGAYKTGEDRSLHIDGGQAYMNNPYCEGKGGGYSAEGAIYWPTNTYYESNNISETTDATISALQLNSVDDVYNSPVDMPIYQALGATSNAEKMMCFLLNERTRELCGETYRWEDLARTKTLEMRWKTFNDGYVRGNTTFNANTHYYRPIPQSFLDAITDENGNALTAEEKELMQNPGY